MCGIAGFNGKRPVDQTKIRWLIAENESRGKDSTGVFGNHLFKSILPAKKFILEKGFQAAVKGSYNVIAHTRAATVGSINQPNAHPHQFGYPDINDPWMCVGVHNGMVVPELFDYHVEELGFKKDEFQVDSQLIFAAIAKHKDFNVISRIEGAMALAFTLPNSDPSTVYLYKRGLTRVLHIGESADGIYYSSEWDPLDLIGCKSIWPVQPDTLYTLKGGKILDMKPMKLPILKSMAANAGRKDWRHGVPHAEISALPSAAFTLKHNNALSSKMGKKEKSYTTDHDQLNLIDNWNGNGSNKQPSGRMYAASSPLKDKVDSLALKESLANKYGSFTSSNSPEQSLQTKFYMLINQWHNELKNMQVTPLAYQESGYWDHTDLTSCLMTVKVINSETKGPLGGWAILTENNIELSSMTSLGGLGVLKVPSKECKELIISLYDPVDKLGPYQFRITPQSGRVMEVTLKIPFQQVSNEKELATDLGSGLVDAMVSGTGEEQERILYGAGNAGDGVYEQDLGENRKTLQGSNSQISGRHQEEQVDGAQFEGWGTGELIPKTDRHTLNTFDASRHKLIPTSGEYNRKNMINYITAKGKNNNYINGINYITAEWLSKLMNDPRYEMWKKTYMQRFQTKLLVRSLFNDAVRIQAWDRYSVGWWYSIHVYIEMLLKERFTIYQTSELLKDGYGKVTPYLPSTLMKEAQIFKNSIEVDTLPSDNSEFEEEEPLFKRVKEEDIDEISPEDLIRKSGGKLAEEFKVNGAYNRIKEWILDDDGIVPEPSIEDWDLMPEDRWNELQQMKLEQVRKKQEALEPTNYVVAGPVAQKKKDRALTVTYRRLGGMTTLPSDLKTENPGEPLDYKFIFYQTYREWCVDPLRTLAYMKKDKLKDFKKHLDVHEDVLQNLENELSESIRSTEHTKTFADQKIRETLIAARNYFRNERSDITDCISGVDYQLSMFSSETPEHEVDEARKKVANVIRE